MSGIRWKRLTFEYGLWQQGHSRIAGVDEAGCGPLAGPVVAAAVILPARWREDGIPWKLRSLNDSKQLSAEEREHFYALITAHPDIQFGIGCVDSEMIDQLNIYRAAHRAMHLALEQLQIPPDYVLVDGRPVKSLPYPNTPLIKGDSRSYSIAAASVLAKVTRDRIMVDFDRQYPLYQFANHKGYSTPQHLALLAQHGPCPIHRRSFAPFKPVPLDLFS